MRTIQDVFAQDHDRLDGLFGRFQENKRRDFAQAQADFEEFKVGLQRHIVWEETILFPLFEDKTSMYDAGPTHVMREEHRRIRAHLEAIDAQLKKNDPESDGDERALLGVLGSHNEKEEKVLYPALDRLTDAAEKAAVFTAMAHVEEPTASIRG